MKKLLITFLLPVLINYLSCSAVTSITHKELIETKQKNNLYVTVKGKDLFYFEAGYYYIEGDSLYGRGKNLTIFPRGSNFSGSINLKDVTELRMSKGSWILTLLLITSVTVICAGIFLISWDYKLTHSRE